MSLIMLYKKLNLGDMVVNNRFFVTEKVVFHNEVLGVDYVIKEVRWEKDLFENKMCLKVIVDTIEEYSNDIIDNIKLRSPLELLPNKPPKKLRAKVNGR